MNGRKEHPPVYGEWVIAHVRRTRLAMGAVVVSAAALIGLAILIGSRLI